MHIATLSLAPDEYPEYKNEQTSIFDAAMRNVRMSPHRERIRIHRGLSNVEVPKLPDDHFDLIYVDGNHQVLAGYLTALRLSPFVALRLYPCIPC